MDKPETVAEAEAPAKKPRAPRKPKADTTGLNAHQTAALERRQRRNRIRAAFWRLGAINYNPRVTDPEARAAMQQRVFGFVPEVA